MPIRIITPRRTVFTIATLATVLSILNMFAFSVKNDYVQSVESTDHLILEKLISEKVDQDDSRLVQWIKSMMVPPSKLEYNLKNFFSGLDEEITPGKVTLLNPSQEFILNKVEQIVGNKLDNKGVFLEAGALDGEFLSNTLPLEKYNGWRGILVEANPKSFKKLLTKNRKSWLINACINTKPWPSEEVFTETLLGPEVNNFNKTERDIEIYTKLARSGLHQFVSKLKNYEFVDKVKYSTKRKFRMACVPLYSIMKALGLFHIDFLALDVEGAEVEILRTLPWDKVSFTIMTIEHKDVKELQEFLRSKGYILVESFEIDHIFLNKNYVDSVVN